MRTPNRLPHPIRLEEIENYESEADYIIYIDGAYIIALNCRTGVEDFRNTDASTVIQATIDKTDCYHLHIKPGVYTISSTIKPKALLNIWGGGIGEQAEGGTLLIMDDDVDGSMFEDVSIFANNKYFFTIQNLRMEGNKANNAAGCGIKLAPTGAGFYWDFAMRDVFIRDFKDDGFYTNDAHGYWIENCPIEGNDGKGIDFDGGHYGMISGCTIAANGASGIDVGGHTETTIIGCRVNDNGTGTDEGILCGGGTKVIGNKIYNNYNKGINAGYGERCIIVGNTLNKGTDQDYGVHVPNGPADNFIDDNYCFGHTTADYDDLAVRTLINGIGKETADAETPQHAEWQIGHIVDFVDSGDASGDGIYIKNTAGNWIKISP